MYSPSSQTVLNERFKRLHEKPGCFVLPNAWDGGSALILFDAGYSYKYTPNGFSRLALSAGWLTTKTWVDEERLFSVHFMKIASGI